MVIKELLEEATKCGVATMKRSYGDWITQSLAGWKDRLHRHAIQLMQQFAYTKDKSSIDNVRIIDTVDLLYGGNIDSLCLVSSDSDFTRLATHLRETGKVVHRFGEYKTPGALITTCSKSVFAEVPK